MISFSTFSLPLEKDENVILKLRKHWILFITDALPSIFALVIPFIVVPIVLPYVTLPPFLTSPQMAIAATAWWCLTIWLALAVQWTQYYLDVWVVTDHKILNINQISLFDREITTWHLDRVQEVTVMMRTMFQTLFEYGTIEVQTAGPTDEYATIHGVSDPLRIQRVIMHEVEAFRSHRSV